MGNLTPAIRAGHYAKKQILCKDWLISWSHRSRFDIGLQVARTYAASGRVLDYGCGDGSFIAMLTDGRAVGPRKAVGAELSPGLVDDCRSRFGDCPELDFVLIGELDGPVHRGAYDLVVCMEVLEHVLDAPLIVERLSQLISPGGRLLVSVPVETGLPLLVKQAARRIAGWRGIGDYPGTHPYTLSELRASLFAGRTQHMNRPVNNDADGRTSHDHKGFNWMALRECLRGRFTVEKQFSSPVTWLPPHLASQAWFLLRQGD